jgi:excisionase family DNA binding protein
MSHYQALQEVPADDGKREWDMNQHVLTVDEAAKLLRISRGSAYEAVRQGVIPSISIGRRILVPWVGLQRLLEDGSTVADVTY